MELTITGNVSPMRPELIDRYISFIDRSGATQRTYITNLRQFAAWLAYREINRPERSDIISYRQYLSTEHEAIKYDSTDPHGWSYRTDNRGNHLVVKCSAATVKIYLQSVKGFFRWTATAGIYPNIADNVHTPKVSAEHKKRALEPADVLAIEKSIRQRAQEATETASQADKDAQGRTERASEQGKRLYAMYQLAVNAGLRTIELERANVRDLELNGGVAYLYIWGKGRDEADQCMPLANEVYEAIREYLDSRSDRPTANSPLFISTGNRSGGKRIAARTISQMLKKAMQGAGYDSDRLTAHSLRHTAATNVLEATNDLLLTQQYMRHRSLNTTRNYLHRNEEQRKLLAAQEGYKRYHTTGGTL